MNWTIMEKPLAIVGYMSGIYVTTSKFSTQYVQKAFNFISNIAITLLL